MQWLQCFHSLFHVLCKSALCKNSLHYMCISETLSQYILLPALVSEFTVPVGIEPWKWEFEVCKSFFAYSYNCLIMHSLEAHQSRKFFRDTKMHFLCKSPPQRNDFGEKTGRQGNKKYYHYVWFSWFSSHFFSP